jgi:phage terminase large subunit-like protein
MVPATSTISVESLLERWTLLWPDERNELLATLNPGRIDRWTNDWSQFSYGHQKPPALGRGGKPWTTWLILGGRGAGKTRAGAEWVRGLALGDREYTDKAVGRIALIGETEHDVREVMIEGVSGLLHVHTRRDRPRWIPSRRRVEWSNGAVAEAFSAEDPESLRGPQFGAAWADEIAKWRHAREARRDRRSRADDRRAGGQGAREKEITLREDVRGAITEVSR